MSGGGGGDDDDDDDDAECVKVSKDGTNLIVKDLDYVFATVPVLVSLTRRKDPKAVQCPTSTTPGRLLHRRPSKQAPHWKATWCDGHR